MTIEAPGQTTYDQRMFRETFEREFTYRNGFDRNTHRFAQRPALLDPLREQSWSYAELGQAVERLAQALAADGVGQQQVVMFQLLNSLEFALLYLAPKLLGAISCPINYRLAAGETAAILDDSRPRVFVYDASLHPMVQQALQMAHHQPHRLILVDLLHEGSGSFDQYLSNAPAGSSAPAITAPPSVWDETTRLYTVGRFGEPKGVPLNNLTEVLSAHDVIMHFPLSPLDRTLNTTPWFHRGGLYSGGPNPVFYVGGAVVPMHRFDANLALDWVERFELTYLIGTPTNLEMLYGAQLRHPRDLRSLRGIITMGAPLEREACIRYQRVLSPNLSNGYGTTEAFWNTFLRPFDLPEKAGSAGRSSIDDDVRVVRVYEDRRAEPDDTVARDGLEVGEVIVRAPGKCTYTYINRPEQAAETFYQGWVYAGDLGTWDEDEFVTIVERKNDMIIAGGENIHPRQIERVLCDHPGVADALVVGVPDEKWGEMVAAYVVRRDETLTAADLNRHCLSHPMLARYKRPRYYRFVEQFPLERNGEKDRMRAREGAARDHSAGLLRHP